jgi:hypothetical protein
MKDSLAAEMARKYCAVVTLALLTSMACGPQESEAQRQRDANTPAGKAGQLAHKAAVEADKGGRAIGRKLDKAAHEAREGWNEDARKDRSSK